MPKFSKNFSDTVAGGSKVSEASIPQPELSMSLIRHQKFCHFMDLSTSKSEDSMAYKGLRKYE